MELHEKMTPAQQFLAEFKPAYERGDMMTLHHLRQGIFGETASLVKAGSYEAEGHRICLPDPAEMMRNSVFYTDPGTVGPAGPAGTTAVEVIDSDSLLAGKRLLDEGYHPAVLNFANRRTAGGGVLGGAGAQEENIFRRSNLFLSLYQFHPDGHYFDIPQRPEQYPMDRNTGGIYSPDVTVFRGLETEGYPLLAEPYRLGIITVAALNRPPLRDPDHLDDSMVEPTLRRMRTIFRIGLKHGHDALVLGAWGCGAFHNPPKHIAQLFHRVMEEPEFRSRYKKIVFAVVDRKKLENGHRGAGNLPAFREEFGGKPDLRNFTSHHEYKDITILYYLGKSVFNETINLVKAGSYEAEGHRICLPDPAEMMRNSVFYTDPGAVYLAEYARTTEVEVIGNDSLLAGKRLLDDGYHPAVLSFANRRVPGLGAFAGTGTQEQNIFRRTNLFMSLYQFHPDGIDYGIPQRPEQYPMDRNTGGIYSPDVTVFRGLETEGYPLLAEPYRLGIITVAALPYPDLKNVNQLADSMVLPVLRKMRTVFRIGLKHGHDALVLGAWGCGDNNNPPKHIAQLFHQVMEEPEFLNRYRKIVFAIYGPPDSENMTAFREEFGGNPI